MSPGVVQDSCWTAPPKAQHGTSNIFSLLKMPGLHGLPLVFCQASSSTKLSAVAEVNAVSQVQHTQAGITQEKLAALGIQKPNYWHIFFFCHWFFFGIYLDSLSCKTENKNLCTKTVTLSSLLLQTVKQYNQFTTLLCCDISATLNQFWRCDLEETKARKIFGVIFDFINKQHSKEFVGYINNMVIFLMPEIAWDVTHWQQYRNTQQVNLRHECYAHSQGHFEDF